MIKSNLITEYLYISINITLILENFNFRYTIIFVSQNNSFFTILKDIHNTTHITDILSIAMLYGFSRI